MPARYFAPLRDLLREQGVDPAAWLRTAMIAEPRLDDAQAMLGLDEVERLVEAARRLSGRADLGFELGRLTKITSHGLLGYGMLSCATVDEALRLLARHHHSTTELFVLRYRRCGAAAEAVYTPRLRMPLETLRFQYEQLALAHLSQLSTLLGSGPPACEIRLAMPAPAHASRYDRLAPARFVFDEQALPGVRVLMDADLLDRPLPLADPRMVREVDARCSSLPRRPLAGEPGWGDYVAMMLGQEDGVLVTLEDLARRVNLSSRTIDRYLRKEGLRFRAIATRVRLQRARALLSAPGMTVAQVASMLGFSDVSNFSRSFRRATGCPPVAYRNRLACLQPG
ncbi:AraC family transcriptional regulator [Pelomonas sp. SE-A7]|uniref:AraC family transcriptional regulator n=1 Tax=Pelomonas sp. SE-A7 TaxID=3054953 RepID=UPI00259D0B0C|nr:AraC family transcriptional regulator [Pelomonas sp. SE-A7]MDM4764768.1 AraC family transcriptional regulator [Pelomonas sp. SE-A7]